MQSVSDIWSMVLTRLREELSETTIKTWFDETSVVALEGNDLVLHCSNAFKRSNIQDRFLPSIEASLRDIFSSDMTVRLLDDDGLRRYQDKESEKPTSLMESGEFTFETFIVGPSNRLACSAARAVADAPGQHYNPLFIYGDSGLGKTHLLYAIAHVIRGKLPSAKILYIKGDEFINDYIETVRSGRAMNEFRVKYREADLMLVDDIQFVAGKVETRSSAGAAAVIQFVGGIHEIYFPYVLMNPIVILGPMVGNMCGIFTLNLLGGGLSGPASPGSIIAELMLTPKGCYFANLAGIAVAGAVSFAISVFLLKFFGKDSSLEEAQAQVAASKAASKGQAIPAASTGASVDARDVRKIVFACDAGMGSSAMGATMVRNKLKDAGITDIEVIHFPVGEIPGDCQIVVTHHELSGRAAQRAPQARIIPIKNFMGAPEYNTLVQELLDARKGGSAPVPAAVEEAPTAAEHPILLEKKNIVLNCKPVSPEEAIKAVGRRMVESGYVEEAYIQGMLDREASFSVAIGSHVAIPHGTEESRKAIKKTGLIVMTYPEGIQWGDELVRLVVGIASTGEDHLGILGKIVEVAETEEDTDKLVDSAGVDQLYKLLNGLE